MPPRTELLGVTRAESTDLERVLYETISTALPQLSGNSLRLGLQLHNSPKRRNVRSTDRSQPDELLHTNQHDAKPTLASPSGSTNNKFANTASMRQMTAYDCSDMLDVTAIEASHVMNCPMDTHPEDHLQSSTPTSFQIVQSTGFYRSTALRFKKVKYTIPQYCTTHSHMTMSIELMRMGQHLRVDQETMRKLRTYNKYYPVFPEMKHIQEIAENTTVYFSYTTVGYTHIEGNDYNCQGGNALFKATNENLPRDHPGFVLYNAEAITLQRVEVAISENGEVTDINKRQTLTCKPTKKDFFTYCYNSDNESYYIEKPDKCHSQLLRKVQGLIHTFPDKKIFTSTDNSMTHFVIGKPLPLCGVMAYATDFQDLFLIKPDLNGTAFQTPILASMNHYTYFNSKMKFLYKQTVDYALTLYQLASQDACISVRTEATIRYSTLAAQQHALNSGTTIRLDDNIFATPNGEVYYRYTCRPIQVTALDSKSCFQALPIQLTPEDQAIFESNTNFEHSLPDISHMSPQQRREERRGSMANTKIYRYFLEPITHRVITASPTVPCSPMESQWKNSENSWIAAGPFIHRPPVKPRTKPGWFHRNESDSYLKPKDYDFNEGGLYDAEQKAKANYFLTSKPRQEETLNVISNSLSGNSQNGPDYDGPVLSVNNLLEALGVSTAWAVLLWFMYSYGQFCTIVVTIYATAKAIGWSIGIRHRYKLLMKYNPRLRWYNYELLCPLFIPSLMTTFAPPEPKQKQTRFRMPTLHRSRSLVSQSSGRYHRAPSVDTVPLSPSNNRSENALNTQDNAQVSINSASRTVQYENKYMQIPGSHEITDPNAPTAHSSTRV